MLPTLVVMLTVAIVLRNREAKVVGRVLPVYAQAGWFTGQEIAALATMASRRAGRQWARRISGRMGAKAMSDYQFAATKLAIIRDSLARGVGERDFAGEERQLLSTVDARRKFILEHAQPGAPMPWAATPGSHFPSGPNYVGGGYAGPPNYTSGGYGGPNYGSWGSPGPQYPAQYPGGPAHDGTVYHGTGHSQGYQPHHTADGHQPRHHAPRPDETPEEPASR
jgi:hypothetical protein